MNSIMLPYRMCLAVLFLLLLPTSGFGSPDVEIAAGVSNADKVGAKLAIGVKVLGVPTSKLLLGIELETRGYRTAAYTLGMRQSQEVLVPLEYVGQVASGVDLFTQTAIGIAIFPTPNSKPSTSVLDALLGARFGGAGAHLGIGMGFRWYDTLNKPVQIGIESVDHSIVPLSEVMFVWDV